MSTLLIHRLSRSKAAGPGSPGFALRIVALGGDVMKQAILAVLCFAPLLRAGTICGRVEEQGSGEPLPGVSIMLDGTLRGTSSDDRGSYVFPHLSAGRYVLIFSMVGYQRTTSGVLTLGTDDTLTITALLAPIALQTEPIVVTASRREESFHDAPASVSIMDAAGIALRNSVAVDDALRYMPGVNMTQYQVNIRGSSGYTQGAGSRVLMLLDGLPFLTGDTGEINFESIPIGQVERIEVMKGASSALYGSGALGGVINVITKPVSPEPETRVHTYGGIYGSPSYSQWDWGGGTRFLDGVAVSHSRRMGNFGFTLYGSRFADDGYRENDSRLRLNGYMKADYAVSPRDDLSMTFNIIDQHRESFLYWKDLDHPLVPTDDQLGETVSSTRFLLSGTFTHAASADAVVTARTMWFHNHFSDTISPTGDNSTSDLLHTEVMLNWSPAKTHFLTLGGEGNLDRVTADLFGRRTGGGAAAYVQDEIRIAVPLRLTVGGRYDVQVLDSLAANAQFNPKAALVFAPSDGTAIRVSAGRGFRTPTVAEAFTATRVSGLLIVPNPSLKPERGVSYEAGVNQVLGGAAIVDLALFETDYTNLIEAGFNQAGQGQLSNVTRARVRGVEAGTTLSFFRKSLFFDLDYTYVHPWDLTADDVLKYRPRHLFYASGVARAGPMTFSLDFRYISRVERIDDEFVTLGIVKDGDRRVPIVVTDLRLGAEFTGAGIPLSATLSVNNLFQYNYVELIGNLAPPRSFVLTLDGVVR